MKRYGLIASGPGVGLVALLGSVASAQLACPPVCPALGGKVKAKSKNECYVEYGGLPEAEKGTRVFCADGDPACDFGSRKDQCDFSLTACLNSADPRLPKCGQPGFEAASIVVKGASKNEQLQALQDAIDAILPAPATANVCTEPVSISVPLRVKRNDKRKKGKLKLKLKAKGAAGGRDSDKLLLTCLPPPEPPPSCPPNPNGGPNKLTLTVAPNADLDAGWTGVAHNQGVLEGSTLSVCLEECDLDRNPVCRGTGETDAGGKQNTINGRSLGPPVPGAGGGVPICFLLEFADDILLGNPDDPRSGFNLGTGEADVLKLKFLLKVFLGESLARPCPICKGPSQIGAPGICQGGPNHGKGCRVEGFSKFGNGSNSCMPDPADNVSQQGFIVSFDATSKTTTLPEDPQLSCSGQGNCHCTGQTRANNCDGVCDASECPAGATQDIDQQCCRTAGGKNPCFAGDIIRTGRAGVPMPAWPEATYAKATPEGQELALAGVGCIAGTESSLVNAVAGLPGPAAFVMPLQVRVDRTVCVGGAAAGSPCGSDDDCPGGSCE